MLVIKRFAASKTHLNWKNMSWLSVQNRLGTILKRFMHFKILKTAVFKGHSNPTMSDDHFTRLKMF
jgi:hypothetical protein